MVRGLKSNARGVPQRRTSTLAVSSRPVGHDSCSRFGRPSCAAHRAAACTASRSCSAAAELRGQRLALREQRRDVLALALGHADGLGVGVALGAQPVGLDLQLLAPLLERRSIGRRRATKPRRARLRPRLGVAAQQLRIEHGRLPVWVLAAGGGLAAALAVPSAAPRQRLADLDLEAARRRRIVAPVRHLVRQIALAGGIGVRLVVRVAIALAVADLLHQPGRRIAQAQRHLERPVLLHVRARLAEGDVDRVALRRHGHEHDGLRRSRARPPGCPAARRSPRPRAPSQRARVGNADVLARHAHARGARCTAGRSRQPACGTASTARHPDRCRAPTCAARRSGRRNARRPCRSAAGRRRRPPRTCSRVIAPPVAPHARSAAVSSMFSAAPRIAVGRLRQQLRASGSMPSRARRGRARVRERTGEQRRQVRGAERLQHIDAGPRQQRVVDLEGRVLGRRADEDERAVLDVRQERVLLRLVEAVHLVEKQHGALAARPARACGMLDRRADVLDARHARPTAR